MLLGGVDQAADSLGPSPKFSDLAETKSTNARKGAGMNRREK